MRRTLLLALLLLSMSALAPGAHAARAGTLAVRSVLAPRSTTPGSPISVGVLATRIGRTPAATVGVYLSTDGKRDRRDVHLAGDARVARGATRSVSIVARPQIPAGQALGAYHLMACIRSNCRAANAPLRVGATPVGTRELVAAALSAHRLTPQQGLVYRVFAALGDPRLPAAYRGDDSEPEDLVMRDVVSQWSTLSASQKAILLPYFTPPAAKRSSSGSGLARPASIRPVPLVQPTCDTNQAVGKDWLTIAKPGGHVRIWWLKDSDKQVGPRARSLLTDVENYMWPRLVAIFGREPLRDGHERCFHGIDDKLDIYMWGLPHARAMTFAYPPDCTASPAYIVFDSRSSLPTRWEVAHELTHAFQFSYDYRGPCSKYSDWDEASATWAAAWLYPKDDDEHAFRWLLRDPGQSLADASYEGWVFAYAMAQLHGPGTIASIYAQTERQPDVLHAIDSGVPGGLKQAWPEFATVAWNQEPVEPNFQQWDNFTQHPEDSGHEVGAQQVDIGATGQSEVDVPLSLGPLTRAYRHFKFGPGVTEVTLDKPSYPGVNIQAILKLHDGTTRTEDWSASTPVFCPKTPGQRLDDLVLVVSNTSLTQPSPSGVSSQVRLIATDIGCSRYRGEASGASNLQGVNTNIDESWTATGLAYERFLDNPQVTPRFLYALRAGTVTWSLSGTDNGCTVTAGPVTLPVRIDGTNGELDMRVFAGHGAVPTVVRDYFVHGFGLPSVQGTETCPNGSSHTRSFVPHTFLSSSIGASPSTIPGDGVLQGSVSGAESGQRTVSYHWHLVPDR